MRVGTVQFAHFIVVNHVTVRDPVASCWRRSTIRSPVAIFERARVRFPPRVTAWKSETFLLNVIVAPSVSAVRVPLMLAIAGVVRVLFVRVSVVALPTRVSVAFGRSIVLLVPVELLRSVVMIPVPLLEIQNLRRFVSSTASQTLTSPVPFATRWRPMFASSPRDLRRGGFVVVPFSSSR